MPVERFGATKQLNNLRDTAVNTDIISDTDVTDDLGSASKRWAEVHSKKGLFVDGDGTFTQSGAGVLIGAADKGGTNTAELKSSAVGSLAGGFAKTSAYAGEVSRIEATASGSFAFGYTLTDSLAYAPKAYVQATDVGAFAFGHAKSGYYGANTKITANDKGTFAGGYAYGYKRGTEVSANDAGCFAWGSVSLGPYDLYATQDSRIKAGGGIGKGGFAQGSVSSSAYAYGGFIESLKAGGFAQGSAYPSGAYGTAYIKSGNEASFAQGQAKSTGAGTSKIFAEGAGAFAQGNVSAGADATSIHASGQGSFCQGYTNNNSRIYTAQQGAFAQGKSTTGGQVDATQVGAFAQGYAKTNNITASGVGSFAHGDTTNGAIVASAANAAQFGVGTNATVDSLQVGAVHHFVAGGTSRIGGDATNKIEIESDGDMNFVAGAGLQFAQIYEEDGTGTLALAAQDTQYQVVSFSVDGEANAGCTPDHTNDHITVTKAGRYLVQFSVSFSQTTSVAIEYDFHIKMNNGATDFAGASAHRNTSTGMAVGSCGSVAILDLPADATVELWVERLDGGGTSRTITLRALSLTLVQIGGTT